MYDMRNRVHPMILKVLRDRFQNALLETMIQVDTKLRESPAFAKPITAYAPTTRAARQYHALAKELIEYLKLDEEKRPASTAAAAGIGRSRGRRDTQEQQGGDRAFAPGREALREKLWIQEVTLGDNSKERR
jgi:hypothetical protein